MKFLEVKNDRWGRITFHSNLSRAGYIAAAFCMLLFISVRPGYAWEIFVAPRGNNYGNVIVNRSSGSQAFEIYNIGTRDLRITHLSVSDTTNYSLNLNSGENGCKSSSPTIAAGRSCAVEVIFSPISLGVKKGIFQISSSDLIESPIEADLFGRGVTAEDNEGDGLPDSWEQQIVDADPNDKIRSIEDVKPDDDFDGDGATNSQEFKNGTNPINARPNTPGLILQANAVTAMPVTPQLETNAFAHSGHNDAYLARFRSCAQAGFKIGEELVLGLISDIYLNSLQVPVFALDLSRRYFWPASFAGRTGQITAPLVETY